jgi:cytochrome c551
MKKSLVCLTLLLSVSLSACGKSATPPQASPGVSPSPGAATGGGQASPSPGGTTGGGQASPSPGGTTGGGQASPSPGAAAGGAATGDVQAVFKQNCISCHGVNLEGGVGPNLQKVGTKYSKDQIVGIITNGRGAMPSFKGKISDNEIGALADWLAAKK